MPPLRPTALVAASLLVASLAAQAPFNATLLRPAPTAVRAGGPFAAAFEHAQLAVVHVFVEVAGRNTFSIERPGSGVIVGSGGLVVTHEALVREAEGAADKRILVQLADAAHTRLPATIAAKDAPTGLALLRVEVPPDLTLTALQLAIDPEPGAPVAVLGFPDGEDQIGFAGVVAPSVGAVTVGDHELARSELLLTDAAIQARCHGAALLSRAGALVGLCSAEHVAHEVSEPTLEDLKRPSYGVVIPARAIRAAFPDAVTVADGNAPRSDEARAVAAVADAVVAVSGGARTALGLEDPYATRRRPGVGSGVVVDSSGLVLTNRHLVDGADHVTVTFRDGESVGAEVVGSDARTNSALLRLRLPGGRTVRALPRGSASGIAVGDPVLAIGNPEGHTHTIGAGVLSATRGGMLQTDAPTGNQNGGGALISLRGELLGVIDAGVRDKIDVAYAMRGDQAKVESSLNLVPSIDLLLQVHAQALARLSTDAPGPPIPAAAHPHIAEVVERVAGSMLNVYIEVTSAPQDLADNPFATPEPRTRIESLGSGVIVDPSGLALTNWHVVDSATEPDGSMTGDRVVKVALRDGHAFPARVLSISREEDLSLLQIELAPGETVAAVELGSSADLRIGDAAIAIGNPHGRANTVTYGVVTAKNQSIRVRGRWAKLPHLLETDAAINAGNSGGALLDDEGRLIGINSAGGSLHSVTGFAIAVDHVREKLHSVLLRPEKLRSPYIGVTVADRDGRVVVHAVDPFGPGARAGIATSDVVMALGGVPVRWSVGVALTVLASKPDEPLRVDLERAGVRQSIDVTPLTAAAWAVFRQTGLEVGELAYRDDPDAVRDVSIAFYREFTKDPTASPSQIPATLVRVVRVHPRLAEDQIDVHEGDLVLGVQLDEEHAGADSGKLLCFEHPVDLQRCFDAHGTYEGVTFKAWIARDGAVRVVELPAKRLIL